jgi:WD40 repeat protein
MKEYFKQERVHSLIELESGDLVSGDSDGDIKIWNAKSCELIKTIHHVYPPNTRLRMTLLADGNVACNSSGQNGLIHIWDLAKEVQVKTLYGRSTGDFELFLLGNNNLASYATNSREKIDVWEYHERPRRKHA